MTVQEIAPVFLPPFIKVPYGGGHTYQDANGRPVPSVTSILREGVPKPALVAWSANTTIDYAIDSWDKLSAMPISERIKAMQNARFTKTRAATVRGTQLHEAAEKMLAGEPYILPKDSEPQAKAYARFLDDWSVEPVAIEKVVGSVEHGYAGTFDVYAFLAGDFWLLDLKTSASGVYSETALQLSAYRYSDWSEIPSTLERLGEATTGVVWLRPDGEYELIPVETGPSEFEAFLAAKRFTGWSKGSEGVIGSALAVPTKVEATA